MEENIEQISINVEKVNKIRAKMPEDELLFDIAENFKVPSAFIVSAIALVFIYLVKNILEPMEYICWATLITSGVDEVTFKQFYKAMELTFPDSIKAYKHVGFIFGTSDKLLGGTVNENKQ